MVLSSITVLAQMAKFLIILSDAPLYWFSLDKSCDSKFHLATRFGMDKENFEALLIAGNLAQYQYRGGGYILHSGGSVDIILAWALLLRLVP